MRAVIYQARDVGDSPSREQPANAVMLEATRPEVRAGEVLIEVHAAGVNMADALQRQVRYPAPEGASDVPGLEVSGAIAEMGAGVDGWDIGQPVLRATRWRWLCGIRES